MDNKLSIMFFPDRIKNILPTYRVLEIGPGANPHPRADVFLEKEFTQEEAYIQSGFEKPKISNKPIHYYKQLPIPFKDKEFDYVICSHVIESPILKIVATSFLLFINSAFSISILLLFLIIFTPSFFSVFSIT